MTNLWSLNNICLVAKAVRDLNLVLDICSLTIPNKSTFGISHPPQSLILSVSDSLTKKGAIMPKNQNRMTVLKTEGEHNFQTHPNKIRIASFIFKKTKTVVT